MTALAADTILTFLLGLEDSCPQEFQVKASTTIYEGAAICNEAGDGYARPVAASLTSPQFFGFAERQVVNSGASGAVTVLARTQGIIRLPVASIATVAITDIGATIYMSDDQTYSKTSTNNVAVGKLLNLSATYAYVYFQAAAMRSI